MHRSLRTLAILAFALVLSACGAMRAQNPGGAYTPVNAVAVGEAPRVMLAGADVVAYFTESRYVQGQAGIRSEYEGVTFQFASAANKALFDASPAKYLPQYGGYCANGLVYGIPWGGDADRFRIIDGKLYIFGGQGSLDAFLLDPKRNLALAEKYWNEEVKGSNSFWQRTKRLVFRVPHYKNGDELAREVAAARGKS